MIDILYIVGRGSQWGNNELRYSLRSIAKYGSGIRNVVVAGYMPKFLNPDNVICVPIEDRTPCKHWNILNAIIEACKRVDLTDDFLYSSDDHFYIKPTDFANYPIYSQGVLPLKVAAGDENWKYHTTLVNTRKLLTEYGMPHIRYSWHGNTHMYKHRILDAEFLKMCKQANTMPEGCEPTCLILNAEYNLLSCNDISRLDFKLGAGATMYDIERAMERTECLSSTNAIGGSPLHDFLYKEFPNKCKYER